MSRLVSAIVIDLNPEVRSLIRDACITAGNVEVLAETDSLIYGYELIRQNQPDIVFVDIREDVERSLEAIRRISTYFKHIMIVASVDDVTIDTLTATMQAGTRELLKRPVSSEDVEMLISKHFNTLLADSDTDEGGRIITVFSNKGGLGKTSIAVNLALALSEVIEKPVALVDLNLQLGDITTFLDVVPKQTIVDVAQNIGRVDAAYLETSLAEFRHGDSHLYILADPLNVEEAEEVTAEQINTVLTVLRASFEYVIIDTTTSFDSKTLTALDLADNIMLVSMVNLPCIRSSQRVLTLFDRLGYDKQKIKLVVNRFVPGEEITIDDVEDTLEHDVFWKIPNQYFAVMTAINRGVPVSTLPNGQAVYQNFKDLARQVTGMLPRAGEADADGSKEKKSLFSSLLGKK